MKDRVRKEWDVIEAVLAREAPEMRATLAKPATQAQVQTVEQTLGLRLPEAFRESLFVHNGQDDPQRIQSFVDHGMLLTTEEIVERWVMNCEIDDRVRREMRAAGERPSSGEWWNPKYMPFLGGGSSMLCIDLDPSHEPLGELVWHVHDSFIERGVAPSYIAWLEKVATRLRSGEFKIDEFGALRVSSEDFDD